MPNSGSKKSVSGPIKSGGESSLDFGSQHFTKMRSEVPGYLISDVIVRETEKPTRLFLLLHGFNHNGEKMAKRLAPAILQWEKEKGAKAFIIAPNGPFPIPERTESGWRVGFSWYFHNHETGDYFIDMKNAIKLLEGLIAEYGLKGVPTTVIGFSQGGYLSPLFAKECPQVDHVIGIGCEFLKDELEDPILFRLDGVHGADDAIVDSANSERSHRALVSRGAQGSFSVLPSEMHKISPAIVARVKSLLET